MIVQWTSALNGVGNNDSTLITVAVLDVRTLFHSFVYTIILEVYVPLEEEDKRDIVLFKMEMLSVMGKMIWFQVFHI